MKGILITAVVVVSLLFAVLNWPLLFARTPVNLLLGTIELPIGISLLILAVTLSLIFFLASLWERAAQLRQVTNQERIIESLRAKLDRQRTTDLETLESTIRDAFDVVRQQIETDTGRVEKNLRESLGLLEERQQERLERLQERVVMVRNELAADIGELENRLEGSLSLREPESG